MPSVIADLLRSEKGCVQIAVATGATALAIYGVASGRIGFRDALDWWGMVVGGTTGAYHIGKGLAARRRKDA